MSSITIFIFFLIGNNKEIYCNNYNVNSIIKAHLREKKKKKKNYFFRKHTYNQCPKCWKILAKFHRYFVYWWDPTGNLGPKVGLAIFLLFGIIAEVSAPIKIFPNFTENFPILSGCSQSNWALLNNFRCCEVLNRAQKAWDEE